MISVIVRMLKQRCVYWAPSVSGRFDGFGRPVSSSPQELRCRWEDTAEEYIDASGTRQVSKAKVLLGQDVELGGMLVLMRLDDLDSGDGPEDVGALEIMSFNKVPDFKGKQFVRTALL